MFSDVWEKDIYGGGTLLRGIKRRRNGTKNLFKDVNWREDDYEPGQIRLEFETRSSWQKSVYDFT